MNVLEWGDVSINHQPTNITTAGVGQGGRHELIPKKVGNTALQE